MTSIVSPTSLSESPSPPNATSPPPTHSLSSVPTNNVRVLVRFRPAIVTSINVPDFSPLSPSSPPESPRYTRPSWDSSVARSGDTFDTISGLHGRRSTRRLTAVETKDGVSGTTNAHPSRSVNASPSPSPSPDASDEIATPTSSNRSHSHSRSASRSHSTSHSTAHSRHSSDMSQISQISSVWQMMGVTPISLGSPPSAENPTPSPVSAIASPPFSATSPSANNNSWLRFNSDQKSVLVTSAILPTNARQSAAHVPPAASPIPAGSPIASSPPSTTSAASHTSSRLYTFDGIFPPSQPQSSICDTLATQTLQDITEGWNTTIVTYGAKGSGRTHTIFGGMSVNESGESDESEQQPQYEPGLIERIAEQLFLRFSSSSTVAAGATSSTSPSSPTSPSDPHSTYNITLSALETENSTLRDLLLPLAPPSGFTSSLHHAPEMRLRDSYHGDVHVTNLTHFKCENMQDVKRALGTIQEIRTKSTSNPERTSSRSHVMVTITITKVEVGGDTKHDRHSAHSSATSSGSGASRLHAPPPSRIQIFDLASSDRSFHASSSSVSTGASSTVAHDLLSSDPKHMNWSLDILSKTITALGSRGTANASAVTAATKDIPWRDTLLTHLLSDALSGDGGRISRISFDGATRFSDTGSITRTSFLCCVASDADMKGTQQVVHAIDTLNFARKVKRVKIHPAKVVSANGVHGADADSSKSAPQSPKPTSRRSVATSASKRDAHLASATKRGSTSSNVTGINTTAPSTNTSSLKPPAGNTTTATSGRQRTLSVGHSLDSRPSAIPTATSPHPNGRTSSSSVSSSSRIPLNGARRRESSAGGAVNEDLPTPTRKRGASAAAPTAAGKSTATTTTKKDVGLQAPDNDETTVDSPDSLLSRTDLLARIASLTAALSTSQQDSQSLHAQLIEQLQEKTDALMVSQAEVEDMQARYADAMSLLSPLASPTASSPTLNSPTKAKEDSNALLQLQHDMEHLRSENAGYSDEVEHLRSENSDLQAELHMTQDLLESMRSTFEQTRTEMNDCTAMQHSLLAQSVASSAIHAAISQEKNIQQLEAIQAELDEERSKSEELKNEHQKLKHEHTLVNQSHSTLQDQHSSLTASHTTLSTQLAQIKTELLATQTRCTKLEAGKSGLESEKGEMVLALQSVASRLESSSTTLISSHSLHSEGTRREQIQIWNELISLRQKNQEQYDLIEKLQVTHAQETAKLAGLETDLKRSEEEKERLMIQVIELTQELEALKSAQVADQESRVKVQELQTLAEEEKERSMQQILLLTQEIEALKSAQITEQANRARVMEQQTQVEQEKDKGLQQILLLTQEIESLTSIQLSADIQNKLQLQTHEEEKDRLRVQLIEAQQQLEQATSRYQTSEQEVMVMKQDHASALEANKQEKQELQTKISSLEATISTLEASLSTTQASLTSSQSSQSDQVYALTQQNANLTTEVEKLQKINTNAQVQLTDLQAKINSSQDGLREAQALNSAALAQANQSSAAEITKLNQENATLVSQVEDIKAKLGNTQTELAQTQDALKVATTAATKASSQSSKLDELQAELTMKSSQLTTLQSELTSALSLLTSQTDLVKQLRSDLTEQETREQALQTRLHDADEKIEKLKEEKQEMEKLMQKEREAEASNATTSITLAHIAPSPSDSSHSASAAASVSTDISPFPSPSPSLTPSEDEFSLSSLTLKNALLQSTCDSLSAALNQTRSSLIESAYEADLAKKELQTAQVSFQRELEELMQENARLGGSGGQVVSPDKSPASTSPTTSTASQSQTAEIISLRAKLEDARTELEAVKKIGREQWVEWSKEKDREREKERSTATFDATPAATPVKQQPQPLAQSPSQQQQPQPRASPPVAKSVVMNGNGVPAQIPQSQQQRRPVPPQQQHAPSQQPSSAATLQPNGQLQPQQPQHPLQQALSSARTKLTEYVKLLQKKDAQISNLNKQLKEARVLNGANANKDATPSTPSSSTVATESEDLRPLVSSLLAQLNALRQSKATSDYALLSSPYGLQGELWKENAVADALKHKNHHAGPRIVRKVKVVEKKKESLLEEAKKVIHASEENGAVPSALQLQQLQQQRATLTESSTPLSNDDTTSVTTFNPDSPDIILQGYLLQKPNVLNVVKATSFEWQERYCVLRMTTEKEKGSKQSSSSSFSSSSPTCSLLIYSMIDAVDQTLQLTSQYTISALSIASHLNTSNSLISNLPLLDPPPANTFFFNECSKQNNTKVQFAAHTPQEATVWIDSLLTAIARANVEKHMQAAKEAEGQASRNASAAASGKGRSMILPSPTIGRMLVQEQPKPISIALESSPASAATSSSSASSSIPASTKGTKLDFTAVSDDTEALSVWHT